MKVKLLKIERTIATVMQAMFIGTMILLTGFTIYQFGYFFGNRDGLKKAYRYEMFKKYPEYFEDWKLYGAEINENGQGKKGMK